MLLDNVIYFFAFLTIVELQGLKNGSINILTGGCWCAAYIQFSTLPSGDLERKGGTHWSPASSTTGHSEGLDRLVIAPTGSGKTMTAVLPLLSRCLNENWEGLSILCDAFEGFE